jgi:hypothetical protein
MIDALAETRGMITLAARRLGCSPNTVRAYIAKYPSVDQAQREHHAQMGDMVELALYDEAVNKRNTAALIFLAKTKFKDRGYVERQEFTGADGGAVEQRVIVEYVNRVPSLPARVVAQDGDDDNGSDG